MTQPLLRVEHLTTSLQTGTEEVALVDDVSFDLAAGEVLGVVGESGSGKTLTAMSILRLLPSVRLRLEGRIEFRGDDLLAMSEREMRAVRGKSISLIPQDPMTALNPTMTIGRQMVETMRLHRGLSASAARRRAIELLGEVQIVRPERAIDAYPHEYSGGMRQRVMIAMALSCEPQIVVADEATSALDVTTQAQVVALLKRLCQMQSTALVFITHNLALLQSVADRVNVMYSGRIVESAPVAELYHDPQSPYSRRLMSAIPDPVNPRKLRLITIEGNAPTASAGTVGCRFAPRCDSALDRCRNAEPELVARGAAHAARCFGTEAGGWIE